MINSLKDFFKNKVKMRSGLNENIILVLLLIVSTIPLWLTDFPPLQDYPDWLYQGKIFADYNKPGADYKSYISLKPVLVASSASTLLIAFFMNFTGPIVAGKLMLCFWLIGMPLCYIYFFRSFRQSGSILELAPLLLLYNIRFYNGNLNYLLSLPLFFFVTGYFQRRKSNFKFFDSIILMALLCLVFIFHFMGFCFTLFSMALLAVKEFKINLKKYTLIVLAMLPSLILAIVYLQFQAGYKGHLMSLFKVSILSKLRKILNTWAICFNIDSLPVSEVLIVKMILNLAFLLLILYIATRIWQVLRQGKWRNFSIEWVGIVFVIVALILPSMFYYVTDADTRLLLAVTFILLPSIDRDRYKMNKKNTGLFLFLFFALIIIHSLQFATKGRQYEQIYKNIESNLTPGSRAFLVMGDFFIDKIDGGISQSSMEKVITRLVPGVAGLARVPYYYYINNDLAYPHIFQTSIFESKNNKIPLMIKPYPEPEDMLAGIDNYDRVVIVGKKTVIEYFISSLSTKTKLILKGDQFAILKVY